jgi:hypothetical protein
LLPVNAFLSNDVTADIDSDTSWTASVFTAAVFHIRLCWKRSQQNFRLKRRVFRKYLHEKPQNYYNYDRKDNVSSCFLRAWSCWKNNFCHLFVQSVYNEEADSQCSSLMKPGFRNVDMVNSLKSRYWSAENTGLNSWTLNTNVFMTKTLVFCVGWVRGVKFQQFPGKNSNE